MFLVPDKMSSLFQDDISFYLVKSICQILLNILTLYLEKFTKCHFVVFHVVTLTFHWNDFVNDLNKTTEANTNTKPNPNTAKMI